MFINDYARGALEALSWIRRLIKEDCSIEVILKEIETAIEDILNGVSVDFRYRLRSSS